MNREFSVADMDSMGLLRSLTMKLKLKADEEIKSLGVSSTQGRVLGYISMYQNDGLIQSDIAKFFNKKNATITSMLQGLEKKGYITRCIQKDNERQKNIYLTEKGEAIISDSRRIFSDLEKSFNNILEEDELQTLHKLLIKLYTNF
ncbi:MAG: MarR family winged helix-turn-helix transcriptional regulator [Clostridium sp.]|uniref:MarR family winged helix-turn-helix transcriptional regulator n=1 Tax=Clostridium sp. TaxID=1506 RepID=UPI003F3AA4C2